jgi:two-component system cell cycle sensor histidine kinase/response regulator CckA
VATPINILIVEDLQDDAELLLAELRQSGFDPKWKRVETEADFQAEIKKRPDIIFSDYSMPQFSGLRAAKIVQESGTGIPFILVSGTVGEDIAVEAMRHGATDYLLKDRIARLGAAIEQALEKKHLRDEAKAAETALVESQAKFRQLADNITDVFWITSPDLHQMHYVSPGYERIWGRSAESLYAQPHQRVEAVLPAERERVIALFGKLMAGEPQVSVEYRIARPDGTVRWVHDRGFQVRDATGNLIRLTGIASDITDRKRTEEEVRSQLRELQSWHEAMLGREERILELKREVNELLAQVHQPARYSNPTMQ